MKYFLIAGEASGDLHAAHLMQAIQTYDDQAQFRFYGGDQMAAVGGSPEVHYSKLAYMGIVPVLMHLPQIIGGMRRCKKFIAQWRPDCVILVDYPGFNLSIAKFVHSQAICPVFYYISPKIWAWKEHRIHSIRRYVDRLFSILPFEVEFFEKKHHYPISYVGNPTVDEVGQYRTTHFSPLPEFARSAGLEVGRPIIALLAGSRKQEIKDNLQRMCQAATPMVGQGYQLVLAGAPSITMEYYEKVLQGMPAHVARPHVLMDRTYDILSHSKAALVTSGTATLETALFRVPQVVCYYLSAGWFVGILRRLVLKVPYVSLVNLICGREVVPELVAGAMTVENVRRHLQRILPGGEQREQMLIDYRNLCDRLGEAGAPDRAAREMVGRLRGTWEESTDDE